MIEKIDVFIKPDPTRVILQNFNLGESRTNNLVNRILELPEGETENYLNEVLKRFGHRHVGFTERVNENIDLMEKYIDQSANISSAKKKLIGTYFLKEYSIESAALFNPSIVPHPQQDSAEGTKFIISLRSTGEGHISSVSFREGIIGNDNSIKLESATGFCSSAKVSPCSDDEVKNIYKDIDDINLDQEKGTVYNASFNSDSRLDERVLFPVSPMESMGMEDVRFVQFLNDDGTICYYGTYTAYNGREFRTQLIITEDFLKFQIRPLFGPAVRDKGMALFPRKINGKYVITSRQDGENIFLMTSENIYEWKEAVQIEMPKQIWALTQLGNCGSPIETDEGWLLIIHGVGALRRYVIGAVLLDKNNPQKVIGVLKDPLIEPDENEREGYVPNVVYSCGAMRVQNNLIIPYAVSDSSCSFARADLKMLIDNMI